MEVQTWVSKQKNTHGQIIVWNWTGKHCKGTYFSLTTNLINILISVHSMILPAIDTSSMSRCLSYHPQKSHSYTLTEAYKKLSRELLKIPQEQILMQLFLLVMIPLRPHICGCWKLPKSYAVPPIWPRTQESHSLFI